MVGKNKVLDFIYGNLKKLESDWTKELNLLNIFNDVEPLFFIFDDKNVQVTNLQSNTMLAFIVLSYDNKSKFLEPHKDRFDNKLKIMVRLAGPSAMTQQLYQDLVYCKQKECNEVIDWYINYQKDWRWKEYMVSKECASQALSNAMGGIDVAKSIKEAGELNRSADVTLDILRTEFLNLDTILEKEEKPKATDMDVTNFLSHEGFIHARIRAEQREEAANKK